ncbi:hypothetical protein BLAT2472_90284 [Burkholderia latens]
MHFHGNEMQNGHVARRSHGILSPRLFRRSIDVPEHVTPGLANVTLHPRSRMLFRRMI